jgi:hypothetical protein
MAERNASDINDIWQALQLGQQHCRNNQFRHNIYLFLVNRTYISSKSAQAPNLMHTKTTHANEPQVRVQSIYFALRQIYVFHYQPHPASVLRQVYCLTLWEPCAVYCTVSEGEP